MGTGGCAIIDILLDLFDGSGEVDYPFHDYPFENDPFKKDPSATPYAVVPHYLVNGDGSSWAEARAAGGKGAFNGLPDNLERDAVYYLAGGEYPGRIFDTPESGDSLIVLKKATNKSHGPEEGRRPFC